MWEPAGVLRGELAPRVESLGLQQAATPRADRRLPRPAGLEEWRDKAESIPALAEHQRAVIRRRVRRV